MPSVQARPDGSLVLCHDRSEMRRLSHWIDQRFKALDLSGTQAYAVRMCLEEAVLNIVMHGIPQPNLAPEITIALNRDGDGVSVDIVDRGQPFDPVSFTVAPRVGGLQDAPVGGFGIPLMRHYASAMHYRRVSESNHLTMQFRDLAVAPLKR